MYLKHKHKYDNDKRNMFFREWFLKHTYIRVLLHMYVYRETKGHQRFALVPQV